MGIYFQIELNEFVELMIAMWFLVTRFQLSLCWWWISCNFFFGGSSEIEKFYCLYNKKTSRKISLSSLNALSKIVQLRG